MPEPSTLLLLDRFIELEEALNRGPANYDQALKEAEEAYEALRDYRAEMRRQAWAYGSGKGTLAGSEDL